MKHKRTDRWYVPQILKEDGEWHDLIDLNLNSREARKEICMVNCFGHKARVIERIAAFRVVMEKDFRPK